MKKLLLVEDNDDVRINTAEILALANYEVITAEDGKAGVEKAIEHKPDLIICDIMMPVLDGYGVLTAVHRNEHIKNTPFIFLTAKSERNDFRKGMELGADDFITKPFSGTELLNAVESRIKKNELLRTDLNAEEKNLKEKPEESSWNKIVQGILSNNSINKYQAKQLIYREGNYPNQLYYILSGKVKVFKINDAGKELTIELLSAGDFLGYIPLLENAPYKDFAEVMEEAELVIISKEEFENYINNNKDASVSFIQILAKNIAEKEKLLIDLAYNSLRQKVARALIFLDNKFNEKKADGFQITLSRASLASIAGTATESLVRTLTEFKVEKLVDVTSGIITILNHKKLEQLAN